MSSEIKSTPAAASDLIKQIADLWGPAHPNSALECLKKYIAIPNGSPEYDDTYFTNGETKSKKTLICLFDCSVEAIDLLVGWVERVGLKGFKCRVLEEDGKTPCIFAVLEGSKADTT